VGASTAGTLVAMQQTAPQWQWRATQRRPDSWAQWCPRHPPLPARLPDCLLQGSGKARRFRASPSMRRYTQANGFKLPTLPAIWRGPQVRADISRKLPSLQQCGGVRCGAGRGGAGQRRAVAASCSSQLACHQACAFTWRPRHG
jgi:hypothetical protein